MSECESVRGEWGKRCPDCGQMLPARQKRLASWHSTRNLDAVASKAASDKTRDEWTFSVRPENKKRRAA